MVNVVVVMMAVAVDDEGDIGRKITRPPSKTLH
jgi:hypothetical protein